MKIDRRSKRSDHPVEATRCLLTKTKQQRSYQALNVASADGEYVVGAPSQIDNTALSMIAPLAGEGDHHARGFLNLVTKGSALKVWKIPLDSDDVYLCAVGGPKGYPSSTISAIQRILSLGAI
jgi:hypothetical protein